MPDQNEPVRGDPRKLTKAEVLERAKTRREQPSSTIEVRPGAPPIQGKIEVTQHQDATTKRKRRENAKFDRMMGASEQGRSMQHLSKSQKRRRRRQRREMHGRSANTP